VPGLAGIVMADLRGCWELNENALDTGTYGNNGTIGGNVTPIMDRFGSPTGAMAFLGDGSDINVRNTASLNLSCVECLNVSVYSSRFRVLNIP
jgi:hypothetical protein